MESPRRIAHDLNNVAFVISGYAQQIEESLGPDHDLQPDVQQILAEIQSGQFAREWVLENQANRAGFLAMRRRDADHQIEEVGKRLRAMMSWIKPPRE